MKPYMSYKWMNVLILSNKHMNVWQKNLIIKVGLVKLKKIGKKRWWAKANALEKIFDSVNFNDLDELSYIDLLITHSP